MNNVPEIETCGMFVCTEPAKQSKENNQNIPGHRQNFVIVRGFSRVNKDEFNETQAPRSGEGSGACFLKVPKRFGPISGATIHGFISS